MVKKNENSLLCLPRKETTFSLKQGKKETTKKRFNLRLPIPRRASFFFFFMARRIAYICIEAVNGPVCLCALPILTPDELEYYRHLIHFPEMDNLWNPFAEAAGQGWGKMQNRVTTRHNQRPTCHSHRPMW